MNKTNINVTPKVRHIEIDEENVGQRLDNYLITLLKGVPKTRIYRIVRKGEVRVNKGRVNIKYRLKIHDVVRIPPVRTAERTANILVQPSLKFSLEHDVIYEDDALIVLNKPSGYAVHGGSGIASGIIEALRLLRPEQRFLELVHRLDKETSGCLLIAKKRTVLKQLHELFRGEGVTKTYLALLSGEWKRKKQWVNEPLMKNISKGGERMVVVSRAGKKAETSFVRLKKFHEATLVQASPKTGRTHQIRVHAAWLGHPIIGDDRYGENSVNARFRRQGFRRLYLHAEQLQFTHPVTDKPMHFIAPLPQQFQNQIDNLPIKMQEPI